MAGRSEHWKAPSIRMGRRCLTFAISLTLGLIAYSFLPVNGIRVGHITHDEWLWVLLLILIGLRIWLSRKDVHLAALATAAERAAPNLPASTHAREDVATDCVMTFNRCISADEFDQLIDTVLDPGSVVVRINETAVLGAHDYHTTVKRTVIRPQGYEGAHILVPVLSPRKGELVDKFSLLVDGKPARTLSHRESTGAAIAVMTATLATAFDNRIDLPGALWRKLRDEILNPHQTEDADRAIILDDLKNEFGADTPSQGGLIARAGLWKLAMDICDTYTIIAVAPISGSSVKVETSYSRRREPLAVPAEKPAIIRVWLWLHIQLQMLFGLVRRSDGYELHLAKDAQSYHFRATAPEGLYVYDLVGTWMDDTRNVVSDLFTGLPLRPLRPHWEVSDTRGLEHVHAYGCDLDVWCKTSMATAGYQTAERTPAIRFELREKPPGLLFVVAFISALLTLLALAIGRWHDQVFVSTDKSAPWPVIIFGLPAIVSGWMVSRFDQANVRLLSISTIGMTAWAVVNATAAVGISAFAMSVSPHYWTNWLGIKRLEPEWSLILVSCIACFTMSCILLVFRVRRYGRRVSGKAAPIVKKGRN